jgi:iron(III) transport system ATP-binding protein
MEALSVDGVVKKYGETTVLNDAALALAPGERAVVYGPTGCGKSTLLLIVSGLVRADAGRLRLFGTLCSGNGVFVEPEQRRLGVVFQKAVLWPHLTALANVELALYREGLVRAERRGRALDALDLLGAADLAQRRPETLSGGQAQRIALARSIASKPRLLLWDEPFTGLDAAARDEVAARAGRWMDKERVTLLAVSHHREDSQALAARILYLEDGKLVENA